MGGPPPHPTPARHDGNLRPRLVSGARTRAPASSHLLFLSSHTPPLSPSQQPADLPSHPPQALPQFEPNQQQRHHYRRHAKWHAARGNKIRATPARCNDRDSTGDRVLLLPLIGLLVLLFFFLSIRYFILLLLSSSSFSLSHHIHGCLHLLYRLRTPPITHIPRGTVTSATSSVRSIDRVFVRLSARLVGRYGDAWRQ